MPKIYKQVPLSTLTTFHIGGSARYFTEATSVLELITIIKWSREQGLPFFVIGGGSNVLASDGGFYGVLIKMAITGTTYHRDNISVGAGCDLLEVIYSANREGLGGWERLAGIPGTIGGAIRGNVGAFGSEVKDFVDSVYAVNTGTFKLYKFSKIECEFSYRQSYFKNHPEWVVTHATYKLEPTPLIQDTSLIEEIIIEREKRHLQKVFTAGSFFLNPVGSRELIIEFENQKRTKSREGRVPAGWLIERAGCKGKRQGDIVSSEQHPNYLVNTGNGTAADVSSLAGEIEVAVHNLFGIALEREVSTLGLLNE